MRVGLINGSPKLRRSASGCILQYLQPLQEREGHNVDTFALNRPHVDPQVARELSSCQTLVFAFPLYVDGVPSHLLSCLLQLEEDLAGSAGGITVYAIANCGFHEGHQARWALNILEHWCRRTGLSWGFGIGFGGGGMLTSIQNVPLGAGPTKNLEKALRELVSSANRGAGGENVFTAVNLPKLVYKLAAEIGWCSAAKANGLKIRDLLLRRGN